MCLSQGEQGRTGDPGARGTMGTEVCYLLTGNLPFASDIPY